MKHVKFQMTYHHQVILNILIDIICVFVYAYIPEYIHTCLCERLGVDACGCKCVCVMPVLCELQIYISMSKCVYGIIYIYIYIYI